MLKLQSIEITQTPYHRIPTGGQPEFGVKLTLQVGDQSYNKLPFELSAEDARDVIALAVERVSRMLTIDFEVSPDEPQPIAEPAPHFQPEPPVTPARAPADEEVI